MNTNNDKYITIMMNVFRNAWLKIGGILILGIIIGGFLFSGTTQSTQNTNHTDHGEGTIWTCSMDPQVRLDEPGQCPICFMDLIPLENTTDTIDPNSLRLSPSAVALAKIQTTAVRRGHAISQKHLSGKIDFDETRVKHIAAWFPGRLERLYVDYTGIRVNKGDHLLEIYSPELYSVQSELIQAYTGKIRQNKSESMQAISVSNYGTVKEKAKLLGLSDSQIKDIVGRGKARSVLQINSPITGIVTHKNAVEGKYVKTGEKIYSIADLSQVWLVLEAYEQDLPWIVYGQELRFTVTSLPGQSFSARISYIDPLVNEAKRSITVRAVLDNSAGLLKPGMLAEAVLTASLNAEGKVVAKDVKGSWVCPMHPEEVSDHPGDCSICGMDLVPLEQISGTSAEHSSALLIPSTSVLKTGKRALVYIQTVGDEGSIYMQKEVVLGPRVGEDYIVLSGLMEGEYVVSHGSFKIDSAMQIAGKQSMMSRQGMAPQVQTGHHHE